MYYLKSCRRCGGDLLGDYDQYGWFVCCLQCGRYPSDSIPGDVLVEINEEATVIAARVTDTSSPQVAIMRKTWS